MVSVYTCLVNRGRWDGEFLSLCKIETKLFFHMTQACLEFLNTTEHLIWIESRVPVHTKTKLFRTCIVNIAFITDNSDDIGLSGLQGGFGNDQGA